MEVGLIGFKSRGDVMNKIFVNKDTDMVEQILKVETHDELPDDYFPNCYAIIDEGEEVDTYNLKYNKDLEKFEVVEGIPAKDEVTVEKAPTTEDFNNLKQENEELKSRLDNLETLIRNSGVI